MPIFNKETIPNRDHTFLNHVLTTLPVRPVKAHLCFEPKVLAKEHSQPYLDLCRDYGIIPSSGVHFVYDGLRFLARDPGFVVFGDSARRTILEGGRFAKVYFDMEEPDGMAYHLFHEGSLGSLDHLGYVPTFATLAWKLRSLGHEGGDLTRAGLTLSDGRGFTPGVELLLPEDVGVPQVDRVKLLDWWGKLKSFPKP